jgi:hypothetical protein
MAAGDFFLTQKEKENVLHIKWRWQIIHILCEQEYEPIISNHDPHSQFTPILYKAGE